MQGDLTEWQARGWGQSGLQEEDEGRRGREVQMSTCHLKVLAGRRGALLTHPSYSMSSVAFSDGGSGQGRKATPL